MLPFTKVCYVESIFDKGLYENNENSHAGSSLEDSNVLVVINNEEILAKNKVGMSKNNSFTGSTGTGMVTNKRVVFKKISLAKILVLGPWALLTEGNLDLDLPYSEIQDVRIGKIKFTKAVIITAKDGNEYAFTSQMGPLSDFSQEWYNHIKKFI